MWNTIYALLVLVCLCILLSLLNGCVIHKQQQLDYLNCVEGRAIFYNEGIAREESLRKAELQFVKRFNHRNYYSKGYIYNPKQDKRYDISIIICNPNQKGE